MTTISCSGEETGVSHSVLLHDVSSCWLVSLALSLVSWIISLSLVDPASLWFGETSAVGVGVLVSVLTRMVSISIFGADVFSGIVSDSDGIAVILRTVFQAVLEGVLEASVENDQ